MDGPKKNCNDDVVNCIQVKNIITKIAWKCKVHKNFSKKNLGLKKRIVTIPNLIATPKLFANVISKDFNQYTLLCVSRLDTQKNLEILILAFSLLAKEFDNWNLKIIGNGSLIQELQNLIKHLNLTKRIKILSTKNNIIYYTGTDTSTYITSSETSNYPRYRSIYYYLVFK